uniref:Uncharacterized protein n=1 Tax=Panagrolaimus sp. ES5 TaxID=591445 RepID=A0AC34F943_9BILA
MLSLKFLFWLSCLLFWIYAFPTGNDGCEGMVRVRNSSTIYLPLKYATFEVPWLRRQYSSFLYKSPSLTYNWNWFKELKIQGLDSTLNNVIQLLDQHNCYFVAYGKGVKNIVIGAVKDRSLLEISGETTCDAFKIYKICKDYFDADNCGAIPITAKDEITLGNKNILKMYDEAIIGPITLHSWGSTYETDRLKWSFSANRGGIFDDGFGATRFIDVTGQSQSDICRKRIIIPVQPKYWDAWCADSLFKTLEFFNLVADGFDANQNLHQFLTASIIKYFNTEIFQKYYCVNVLGGEFTPSKTFSYQHRIRPFCHYLAPDARRTRLINIINTTLHSDLGDFWHRNVTYALEDLYQAEIRGKPQRRINIAFDYEIRQQQYQSSSQNDYFRQPYYPPVTSSPPTTTNAPSYYSNRNYNNQYPQHNYNKVDYSRQQTQETTATIVYTPPETTTIIYTPPETTTIIYTPPETSVIPLEIKYYRPGEYPRVLSQAVDDVPNPPTINPPTTFKPLRMVSKNVAEDKRQIRYYTADEVSHEIALDYP